MQVVTRPAGKVVLIRFRAAFFVFRGEKYMDSQVVNLENIENVVNDYIENICIQEDIDIKDIRPIKWLYIINRLHRDIIAPNVNVLLKIYNNKNNQYDINKVVYIYNIYKNTSLKFMQEVTLKCFCDFSGIERQTIYNWSSEASSAGFDIYEKIMTDNEQSLEQLLKDKSINPMKILPILNRKHNWNMPGVKESRTGAALVARENMQLLPGENSSGIDPGLPTIPE